MAQKVTNKKNESHKEYEITFIVQVHIIIFIIVIDAVDL